MSRDRSPRLARTLSFWMPGVGQMYQRRWVRGALRLAGCWFTFDCAYNALTWQHVRTLSLPDAPVSFVTSLLTCTAIWLWAAYDAGRPA